MRLEKDLLPLLTIGISLFVFARLHNARIARYYAEDDAATAESTTADAQAKTGLTDIDTPSGHQDDTTENAKEERWRNTA